MEQQSGQQPAVLSNELSAAGNHCIPDCRVSPGVSVVGEHACSICDLTVNRIDSISNLL